MSGRERKPRPHAAGFTEEFLDRMLDEMEGIRDTLDRAFPEPSAPESPAEQPPVVEQPAEPVTDSVPVDITEPAVTPDTPPPPRKRAAKATPPASKES